MVEDIEVSWPSDEILLGKIGGSRGLCGMGTYTIKTEDVDLQVNMVAGRISSGEKTRMFKKLMQRAKISLRVKRISKAIDLPVGTEYDPESAEITIEGRVTENKHGRIGIGGFELRNTGRRSQ